MFFRFSRPDPKQENDEMQRTPNQCGKREAVSKLMTEVSEDLGVDPQIRTAEDPEDLAKRLQKSIKKRT